MNIKKKFNFGLFVIAVVLLIPIIFTFTNSFMSPSEIQTNYSVLNQIAESGETVNLKFIPDQVSMFQYYQIIIAKSKFIRMLWNSFFYVVPIVVLNVCISTMAAFVFAKMTFKFKDFMFFIYIMLMLMPFQVTLVPNYFVLDKLHLINNGWSIILPGVFNAFGVFLLRQYISSIPNAIIEASMIDGCSLLKTFRYIILPNIKSGIAALCIISFIDNWNMVEQPLIFLNDANKHPMSLYLSSLRESELGVSFAASIIFMIPVILLFLYGEKYLIDGVSHITVKGVKDEQSKN